MRGIALFIFSIFFSVLNAQDKNTGAEKYPFQDPELSFDERVNDLIYRMTAEEKISQMQNEAPAIPRLGIPYYNWSGECLHGIVNEGGTATVFPQAIGMAATWNPELIKKEADAISTEARAWYYLCLQNNNYIGVHKGLTFWSPNINIFRDPRWGRGQETYGEDPFLTSKIGVAFVQGLQGSNPKYFKTVSTPKHYAVHSGPEPLRHKFDAKTSLRDLYETYLPAFEACVKEGGAYSIMGAYSGFQGIPCCGNDFLLNEILRDSWGFKGYVVSDCGAIADIYNGHKYKSDAAQASALAVKAGCDITCGTEYTALSEALQKGYITESEIDIAVSRLMTARMKLGMFDPPDMVPYSKISPADLETEENRLLALQVARESIVLLNNQSNLLPLDKNKIKSIAVIGPYIQREDVLYGNYNGISKNPVTFLKGIMNKAGDKIKVNFSKGISPYDEGGALTTVPSKYLQTPDGSEGLKGEYFDNPELIGESVFVRNDTNMEFYWDKNPPAPNAPADLFSVRWTGTITPPESGTYDLGIVSDDRSRFYFENNLMIDNWCPYEMNVMKTCRVKMEEGHRYKIRMEFADSIDYAGIRFRWKKDNSIEEIEENKNSFDKAVYITEQSDIAIVFLGISANLEGEEMSINLEGFRGGDRVNLDIPKDQERLLKALVETGKPLVLVLTSGSALSINWENEYIPAIVHAWYPGQEGGNAVADILFGDYNPAGRLPVTFYKSVEDLPPFEDYNMEGRTYRYFRKQPLYPFGYGLSYTKFEYSGIDVDKEKVTPGDTINISVTITNTGAYDGDEVVQLYVSNLTSKEPQPIKSLKGFKRSLIKKDETITVTLPLCVNDLKYYDEKEETFIVEEGEYELQIGASSSDIRLRQNIRIVKSE